MKGNIARMSVRGLKRLCILECLPGVLLLGGYFAQGKCGMLTVMLTAIMAIVMGGFFLWIGRYRGGYYTMIREALGGCWGRVLAVLYLIRFAIHGGMLLGYTLMYARRYLAGGTMMGIGIPLGILLIYGSFRTPAGRGRFGEYIFWWIMLPIIAVMVMGMLKMEKVPCSFDQPILCGQWIRESYQLLGVFLPLELLLFTSSEVEATNGEIMKNVLRGLVVLVLVFLAGMVLNYSYLGIPWTQEDAYAFGDTIGLIVPGMMEVERLDLLVLFILLMGLYVTLSGYGFVAKRIMELSLHKGRTWWLAGVLAISLFYMVFIFAKGQQLDVDGWRQYIARMDLPLALGLPILVWIGAWCRGRTRRKMYTAFLIFGLFFVSGCGTSAAIEDKRFVEDLYIISSNQGVVYALKVNGQEEAVYGRPGFEDIAAFNQAYCEETGKVLSYAHLERLYLLEEEVTREELEILREETKLCLLVPVYFHAEEQEDYITFGELYRMKMEGEL